ncbi:HAMP domain-containing sensor histidine kinase [Ruminococcus sp. Marseille-P6503]|uniref:sensor histidine kinase n=1 Tax=Ruminococcus sp. Marseille-P6503 TaxID=2364796 RepID=UPI001FA96DCD|nr:HAMP domain-containing sensor histidine kinase [Ruminococcus sp. Marseille-P6503]
MKTSLQFKLALMFFVVMLVSASISISALLLIFSPIMEDNAEQQLRSVTSSMDELEKLNKYTADEIVNLCTNSSFSVKKISDGDPAIKGRIKEIEEKGTIIESPGILPNVTAYTSVNGEIIAIDSFTKENVYWVVNFIVIIAFIVCIVLGTVITAFISRSILQPIRDLNKATTEVARGNFSVRVRESMDAEYGTLTRNFNRMAEELSGIETLRGDFISSVSHEFKTPLASIQGFARLLQDESISDSDRREYTQIIIDETVRLTKLASNILKLSKLENQNTIGSRTRFSLDEQIRKIILMLEPEWSEKNISLDIALDDIYYYGNEDLIGQVWQNIINNAIKFTPAGGKIKVQLYQTESNITVRISDNGIGISHEDKEKIFEKFYQGDHSRKTEGNGLGLALVKRIIDLCGGRIYVENLYEGGVCFVAELPFVIEDMK